MEVGNRYIYVIDDEVDVRKSLHFLLATFGIRSWPFARGQDFVAQVAELKPAPVLLDIRMPVMDGFGVMREMQARSLNWPIIVMTGHGDIPVAVRAMKQGAIEFIEKPFPAENLELALGRAFELLERARDRQTAIDLALAQLSMLTSRELEVLKELVKGAPNKVTAYNLGLSIRTVEMHRRNAMKKLRLKSLAEAALIVAVAEPNAELS